MTTKTITEYARETDATNEEAVHAVAASRYLTLCEEDGEPISLGAAIHALEHDEPEAVYVRDE